MNKSSPAPVPPPSVSMRPISKDPPTYNRSKHGSMRKFGRKQFSWWSRGQCLTARNSVQFFCLCFENDIERTHIDKLALDEYGNSKFGSVGPLVERVIADLQFDEETGEQLRLKFDLYRAKANHKLDAEFMRCLELREEGWPCESDVECFRNAKYQFSRKLALGDSLHDLLFTHCKNYEWSNAATYFEASTQLRELQNMFNSSQNAHGTCSKSKPTSTNVPQPMDTSNNIGITGEQLNNLNHESQQSQAPNQNFQSSDQNQAVNQYQTPAPTFNNVSKTCRNEVCKKPFTASNPKFYCCSKECVATWKLKRYGAEDQARKKKPKSFNNMSAPASNNNADTDAVSKKYYITPCHVYSAGSNIPIVIRNSLFDTGASLTFITIDLLKKLNLEHIMTRDADDKGVRGGDQRPMKGYIGRCELEVAIEDTTGFLTKNFKQEMLVYEGLNHDLVIGQDAIGDGIRSFFGIPLLDLLIFNPTTRQMKTANNRLAEFEKKSFNNFNSVKPVTKSHFKSSKAEEVIKSEKCFSETKVYESATVYSSSAPEFSDAESFLLNIPQSKLNESMRCLFEEKVSELTTGFLNNVEQYGETSLSDILTTGGLDGTFDTKNIKVEDTKIIETSKGQVKVGQQLSDNMCKKFAKFVSDFKGKVFDHTTLGQTKQECCPEMKPGESSTPTIPKYMPLNPFMQSEARVLVQQMVDLGVLEKCNEPANSTIFIVQKSSGKWRLICDLKDYNKKIVDYVVHLPSPFELINKICTFKMFSYLDFSDAYFQVPLSEKCLKENPIVASVSGLQYNFKYLKMAQGLKIATAWFIGILNNIYAKVSDWVVNYLDDSVLGSDNDEEQHFVRAVEFVKITNEAGLRISLPKSVFFATDLCFLNYSFLLIK